MRLKVQSTKSDDGARSYRKHFLASNKSRTRPVREIEGWRIFQKSSPQTVLLGLKVFEIVWRLPKIDAAVLAYARPLLGSRQPVEVPAGATDG
jgi:hypothetical protein